MKQMQFHRAGSPADVIECVDVSDVTVREPDDVLVEIKVFPINPADLLTMQGFYPRSVPHSPTLGIEALGIIEAVGEAVIDVAPGDRVILLSTDNWTQKKLVKAHEVVRVSSSLDSFQLAALKVNPATAALILKLFVDLRPGDWLLQNAANSAVGRAIVQIAKSRELRTVNVVRRPSVAEELKEIGADIVLVGEDDLPQRVAEATHGAAIGLAADAIAGESANRLASCLAAKGSLVIYGAMGGAAAVINPGLLVFQDISVHGFWLARHLACAPRPEIAQLYAELERLAERGQLICRVDSVFPAVDIQAAVSRASEAGGAGKVFVTFE